jgi:amino acid adenylation domain-containing protein
MRGEYNFSQVDFNPFTGPEIVRVAPATEAQLEIWTSFMIGGEDASRAYNESVSLDLFGDLDDDAMIRSLYNVVERHEALRTVFSADGKQLCVFKSVPAKVKYNDISALKETEQQQIIDDYLKEDAKQSFDLLGGPLFRIALFKQSIQKHYLVFSAHHIVCDGWSLGIIIRDLSMLYRANQLGLPVDLPAAPLFSEYAVKQIRNANSRAQAAVDQYWINQYKNDVPVLDLPTDFERPKLRTYKSRRDDYPLDASLVSAIKKVGASNGCSFVVTMVAAFEVYLNKLTNQQDIVLGLPAAGQSASGSYDLVGHGVNLLPLRSKPDANQTFADYLKGRKSAVLDAFEHQNLTFGSLLKKLSIKRDPSRVPLIPVVFNVDMGMDNGVDFGSLRYKLTYNPREYETFELFVNIADAEGGLQVEWSYNTQLFKPETIEQMMGGFKYLLKTVVNNPGVQLKDVLLMDSEQLYLRLKKRNDTTAAYPSLIPVHQLIDDIAQRYPQKIAVRSQQMGITYRDLVFKANQLAQVLINNNVMPGDKVGLALDRSIDMVVALLAILKSGAAYVPLDVTYPQDRLVYMLEDSEAKVLLTSTKYEELIPAQIVKLFIENDKGTIAENIKLPVVGGKDLAYLIYTSGSTGKPKGVGIAHCSLVNFLCSMQKEPGVNVDDKLLAVTTISFDIAGLEIYLPLITGASLVLADTDTTKDGRALLQTIYAEQITVMQATPATWKMMLDAGWSQTKNLKVLCGGEALSKTLANQLVAKSKDVWNMYGPTETTIWSTTKQISKNEGLITVGAPIANTQVYILDDYSKPVADGAIGEIAIGGDGVANGYYRQPELTASKFIINKFLSDTPIYLTGDLGKFDEQGDLVCLGRADQQIKIRGYRIEVGEIEQQLMQLSDVNGAVVLGVVGADGLQRLVGYVTTAANSDQHTALIQYWRTKLKGWLPAHMIPSELYIIAEFPLTPNGKIDRKTLGSRTDLINKPTDTYTAPRNAVEQNLAEIWAELMGVEKVGIYDDFFELGGHSLIAAQMMAEVEKRTGKYVPLSILFAHPTIEKLAERLQHNKQTQGSLVAIKPTGNRMPVFIIHGAGLNVLMFNFLATTVDVEQPIYALQAKGLNGIDEPADDVKSLASYYISEILTVSPDGPVALAGYSLGGIIAIEMAEQLTQMGREVKMLAMIDSYAEVNVFNENWYVKIFKKLGRQVAKLWFVIYSLFTSFRLTVKYQNIIVKNKVKHVLGMTSPEESELVSPLAKEIYNRMEAGLNQYKLLPYDGVITIFKAKVRAYYVRDQKYLGWKPFALKGVKTYDVPGDHKQMFDASNNKIFAEMLQEALNEAAK